MWWISVSAPYISFFHFYFLASGSCSEQKPFYSSPSTLLSVHYSVKFLVFSRLKSSVLVISITFIRESLRWEWISVYPKCSRRIDIGHARASAFCLTFLLDKSATCMHLRCLCCPFLASRRVFNVLFSCSPTWQEHKKSSRHIFQLRSGSRQRLQGWSVLGYSITKKSLINH